MNKRTSLIILALVLGSVGCQQKESAPQQVAVPAPEPGERPSFYNSNNIGEYYGRCPKCQQWVKGFLSDVSFVDDKGGKVYCVPRVTGTCQYCSVLLFADESGCITNESRMVWWMSPVGATTDDMGLFDNGTLGLHATNVSPFTLPK